MDPIYLSYEDKFTINLGSRYTLALNVPTLQKPPHEIHSVNFSYKHKADIEFKFILKVKKIENNYVLNIEFDNNADENNFCNLFLVCAIYNNSSALIKIFDTIHVTETSKLNSFMPLTLGTNAIIEEWVYQHDTQLLLNLTICDPAYAAGLSIEKGIVENPSICMQTESKIKFDCGNDCKFLKDISCFLSTESMSDVIISTKDKKLNAHKCILAARSTVFKELFTKKLEKNEHGDDIIVLDAESVLVEEMLRYMYMGSVEKLDEIVIDLYEMGNKYKLLDLQETCVSYINKNISVHNAINVMLLARRYDVDILLETVVDFFAKYADEILADAATSEALKPFFDLEFSSSNFDL